MSTDLDRMFTALGRDADEIPLGAPSTARRRGERRRRTHLVAAGLATACVLAAGMAGGSWLKRDAAGPEPVAPPPDRPVQLGPARPLGDEIRYGGQQVRFGLTAIAGNRAYAGWQEEDGTLRVAAADLETGKAAWPARTLGEFDDTNGIIAVPRALLAIGERNDGTVPDQQLYVVDPDTGRVRWELPFDINGDDLLFYDSVLVHVTEAGAISARDWGNGQVVWAEAAPADPPVESLGVYGPADALPGSDAPFPAHLSDPRLLQITAGGALVVRDSATGAVRSTRPGVGIGADSHYLAYDGRLYITHRGMDPNRVVVADVDGAGAARELRKAAPGSNYLDMVPCGTDRICLLEGKGTDESTEIAAVDVASGREVWRKPAPNGAQQLVPGGARVLVAGMARQPDETSSALFDQDGTQLLGEADQRAALAWVSTGTLLSFGDGKLAAVTAADGSRQELGDSPIKDLRTPRFCSWTERRLVCPGLTGFQVWGIAPR